MKDVIRCHISSSSYAFESVEKDDSNAITVSFNKISKRKKKLSLILQHVHCTANKQPPILQEIKVTINHLSIFSLVCSIQFIVILVPVLVLVPNNTLYETQLRGKIPLIAIIKFQIISQFE